MVDPLEQQLVNELNALIKPLNEKYKDFFHIGIMTLMDMGKDTCTQCCENKGKCFRAIFAVSEKPDCNTTQMLMDKYDQVLKNLSDK